MEYERALFRVYDKSMEGFRAPSMRKACNLAQQTLLVVSAALFACLALVHRDFVNNPGCLGPLLEAAAEQEGVLLPPETATQRVRAITANSTLGTIDIPDADSVVGIDSGNVEEQPPREKEGGGNGNHPTRIQLPSGAWIPYDVLVGVSIGGRGGGHSGRRWWGMRGAPEDEASRGTQNGEEDGGQARRHRALSAAADVDNAEDGREGSGAGAERNTSATRTDSEAAARNGSGFSADYTFAFEPIVLLLPDKIQDDHAFKWVNFTIEPAECFDGAGFMSRVLAANVLGYDVIMANMFMFSVESKGLLKNVETGAEWVWSTDARPKSRFARTFWTLAFKIQVVVRSVTAFVLMSTVTAMTVRTLLSSGVVMMFPMVMLMERMGLGVELRMLALSYPWLGLPIEHLRHHNKPIGAFIMGHIMQMAVFYTVYNACLLAWSYWLYGKTMTTSLQVWLYGMVMLWEYFALIFVRARSSIVFFSRTAALSFMAFHVYFYHFQMGFFGLAAASAFSAMFAVKLYVLQAIELPAYVSGDVSHEQPRAHFVELPWPAWGAALPPIWSLFIPPNASSIGVYGDSVPERPEGNAGGADDGGAGGRGERGSRGGGEAQSISSTRGVERGRARARGRGRARARALATGRPGRTEQERPLVGSALEADGGDSGEEIEMARRRRGAGLRGDVEQG